MNALVHLLRIRFELKFVVEVCSSCAGLSVFISHGKVGRIACMVYTLVRHPHSYLRKKAPATAVSSPLYFQGKYLATSSVARKLFFIFRKRRYTCKCAPKCFPFTVAAYAPASSSTQACHLSITKGRHRPRLPKWLCTMFSSAGVFLVRAKRSHKSDGPP